MMQTHMLNLSTSCTRQANIIYVSLVVAAGVACMRMNMHACKFAQKIPLKFACRHGSHACVHANIAIHHSYMHANMQAGKHTKEHAPCMHGAKYTNLVGIGVDV